MSATPHLLDEVRERAPMTVAAFMDLALYHPELGYYARAAQRSGRAGDFFTSVDVGPLFGDLLAVQIAEMAGLLDASPSAPFDLVEAGAGNGRLSADILRALRVRAPSCEARTRLHLVEASPAARAAGLASTRCSRVRASHDGARTRSARRMSAERRPLPAPASTRSNGAEGEASSRPAISAIWTASRSPNSGPTSTLVKKSPARPDRCAARA